MRGARTWAVSSSAPCGRGIMSRIGRMPVTLPDGVKVQIRDGGVRVEGPKGTLTRTLDAAVSVTVEGKTLSVARRDDSNRSRGLHGLSRRLIANMVDGGSKGFTRSLEITGVGYRAGGRGHLIWPTPGHSRPAAFPLPAAR